jgi:hypothetical protein
MDVVASLTAMLQEFIDEASILAKASFTQVTDFGKTRRFNDEIWRKNEPEVFERVQRAKRVIADAAKLSTQHQPVSRRAGR